MDALLVGPWPWYIAGPLIGLVVPALLLLGGKSFGISANFRHLCALTGSDAPFFRYDWKREGGWNLAFAAGIVVGGFLATRLAGEPGPAAVATSTVNSLRALGLNDLSGAAPTTLISWSALATLPGVVTVVGGGFLVGFGARWAGGCTSGHAISGLSSGQLPSLLAVVGFFVGGLVMTHVVLPWLV